MRGRLTVVWSIVPAFVLMIGAGCQQTTSVPPVDPDAPAVIDDVADPMSVFLSANRPRLIRNDAVQGTAVITARASREAQLRWSYAIVGAGRPQLEGRPARELIQVAGPSVDDGVVQSSNTIESIIRDPGLEGSIVRVTVSAFEPESAVGPNDVPLDTAEVLVVLARPQSALRVNAVSESGVSLEPLPRNRTAGQLDDPTEFQFTLRADIDGGTQFNRDEVVDLCDESVALDACCRQADAGAGEIDRYHVKWRMVGSPEGDDACLLGPIAGAEGLLFDDPITGVVSSSITFTVPGVSGNVAFEVVVTDASGNRGSATVDVTVAPDKALTVADAAPQSPLVEPGRCVTVQATGQGGIGSYVADFTVPANQTDGRLIPGPCAAVLDASRLSTAVRGIARADGVFEAAFWAVRATGLPGRGSVLVTATIGDQVSAAAATSFPIEMRASETLAVSATFEVPAIDLNRTRTLTARVSGGTAPYTVCFSNPNGAGGILQAIAPAVFTTGNGLVNCLTAATAGNVVVNYTSPGVPGAANVTVTVRDVFDTLAATTGITITPAGAGNGGGGAPPACPGGFVAISATAAKPVVCFNDAIAIDASTTNGTGPFTYTFEILGLAGNPLQTGEGLGLTFAGGISPTTPDKLSPPPVGCGGAPTTSTQQLFYFSPDASPVARTIQVRVTDAANTTSTSTVTINTTTLVANAGPDLFQCGPGAAISIGGAPTASGGLPPFTFAWNDQDPVNCLTAADCLLQPGGVCAPTDVVCGLPFLGQPTASNTLFDYTAAGVGTYNLCVVVADGNGCTTTADCMTVAVDLTACDDNNECTFDFCSGGGCQHTNVGNGIPCSDDGNQCTNDICQAGVCTHPFRPVNTPCNVSATPNADNDCTDPDTCNGSGTCLSNDALDGTACTDTGLCTQNSLCAGGVCTGGNPISCNDGIACTIDSCNPGTGLCINQLQPNTCQIGGMCFPNGTLNPSSSCQVCNVASSTTSFTNLPANTACADEVPADPCTDNVCGSGGSAGVCLHPNNAAPCDDMDACTINDVCTGGTCGGTDCAAQDPTTPLCNAGACECEITVGGDSCDDALFCNGTETCVAGACMPGMPPTCQGATPLCSDVLGSCVECLLDADCDDGLFCNGPEVCTLGVCGAGNPPMCVGQTQQCSEVLDSCVQCLSDADCPGGAPTCNVPTGVCN